MHSWIFWSFFWDTLITALKKYIYLMFICKTIYSYIKCWTKFFWYQSRKGWKNCFCYSNHFWMLINVKWREDWVVESVDFIFWDPRNSPNNLCKDWCFDQFFPWHQTPLIESKLGQLCASTRLTADQHQAELTAHSSSGRAHSLNHNTLLDSLLDLCQVPIIFV